jgi:hypothetical protein
LTRTRVRLSVRKRFKDKGTLKRKEKV